MPPITKIFFFMAVSNVYATERSVAASIGEAGFHPSFSETRFFVTKCVKCGICHSRKHIPRNWPAALVYIPTMQEMPHILIVDDHREIRDLVSRALTKEGFRVSVAADGRVMRKLLADSRIDLILLDLMLPGEDGLSLCRGLRTESNIPIIMLTAKGDEVDRVIGLEMGADDYLPKPFGSRELVARIRAVLRRSNEKAVTAGVGQRPRRYRFDRWALNTGTRDLLRDDGVTVPLNTGEYDLLIALVERPQRVLSRDQLLDLARGRAANTLDRSVDTQVSRLRKKLELDPSDPKIIKTVWGGGYIFTPAVSHE
jgi:two-component system OmpR family response regulator